MKSLVVLFLVISLGYANSNDDFKKGMNYLLGIKKDKIQAFYYLKKASQNNHAEASYNLALMYYMGDGIDQNISMCAKLLESSAKDGYKKSIDNVGRIYMQLLKFDKAIEWLKINAKNGDIEANYLLAEIYVEKGIFKDAKTNAKVAIDNGNLDAKNLWDSYNLSKY